TPTSTPTRLTHYPLCVAATSSVSYPLSLHDALPISRTGNADPAWTVQASARQSAAQRQLPVDRWCKPNSTPRTRSTPGRRRSARSEEHTSELQSRENLVCRLLLAKKKRTHKRP